MIDKVLGLFFEINLGSYNYLVIQNFQNSLNRLFYMKFNSIRPASLDSFALEAMQPIDQQAKPKFMAAKPSLLSALEPLHMPPH